MWKNTVADRLKDVTVQTVAAAELGESSEALCPALIPAGIWKALSCHRHSGGSKSHVEWERGRPASKSTGRAGGLRMQLGYSGPVQIAIPFWHRSKPALRCAQKECLCLILSQTFSAKSSMKTLNGPVLLLNFVVCLRCGTGGCPVCQPFSPLKTRPSALLPTS